MFCEQSGNIVGGHGWAEEIALRKIASYTMEIVGLSLRFDALCHSRYS